MGGRQNARGGLGQEGVGFSLVELVVAIGVVGILLAVGAVVSRQFHAGSLLRVEAEALASDLRRAQARAVAGQNDDAAGVAIEATPGDRWVLFFGGAYTPGASSNEVHVVPASIDITSVALTGGATAIVFTERRGMPSAAGTITFRAPTGQESLVTVSASGLVEIQ